MSVWTDEFTTGDYARCTHLLRIDGFTQPSLEEQVTAALEELRRLRERFRAEVAAYEAGLAR